MSVMTGGFAIRVYNILVNKKAPGIITRRFYIQDLYQTTTGRCI